MPDLLFLVFALAVVLFRELVIAAFCVWAALPGSRMDLDRFERVMTIVGRHSIAARIAEVQRERRLRVGAARGPKIRAPEVD